MSFSGTLLGQQEGCLLLHRSTYRILPVVRVEFYLQELLLLSKAKQQEAGEHQCVKYLEQLGAVMQHHLTGP